MSNSNTVKFNVKLSILPVGNYQTPEFTPNCTLLCSNNLLFQDQTNSYCNCSSKLKIIARKPSAKRIRKTISLHYPIKRFQNPYRDKISNRRIIFNALAEGLSRNETVKTPDVVGNTHAPKLGRPACCTSGSVVVSPSRIARVSRIKLVSRVSIVNIISEWYILFEWWCWLWLWCDVCLR